MNKKNSNPGLVVVGSIGLDTIETPWACKEGILGGSASFACAAASFFARPGMIGVVGRDFPPNYIQLFEQFGIDLEGLQKDADGDTFKWSGVYETNMNNRRTRLTELGVFADFSPKMPEAYRECPFVFLANIAPELQSNVLSQIKKTGFVVADTMDLWINTARPALLELLPGIDLLMINDSEIKVLTEESNIAVAARKILETGVKHVIVKKGADGSMLFTQSSIFALPAIPVLDVVDPTGAGDAFAGGFTGYLSKQNDCSEPVLRKAMAYGTAVASFAVESFSLEKLQEIDMDMIEERVAQLKAMTDF